MRTGLKSACPQQILWRKKMTKKDIKELIDLPLNDFGNALRLQTLFGKRWVYLPQFKCWMFRGPHSWNGKRTLDAVYAAARAFRDLVQAISRLPEPKEEMEKDKVEEAVEWLLRSECPTHARNAVYMYRDMQLAEEAVKEEVLRG